MPLWHGAPPVNPWIWWLDIPLALAFLACAYVLLRRDGRRIPEGLAGLLITLGLMVGRVIMLVLS